MRAGTISNSSPMCQTRRDYFSLAHVNLIFFCLCVNGGFHLIFMYVDRISFCLFRTILSQTLTSVSSHLFSICFVHFLVLMHIALSFLSCGFDVSCGRLVCFLFFFLFSNHPISFIFASNFRHSWLGTTNIFRHTSLWIAFLNGFYDLSILWIGRFFFFLFFFCYWSHVFLKLSMPNSLLKSGRTIF